MSIRCYVNRENKSAVKACRWSNSEDDFDSICKWSTEQNPYEFFIFNKNLQVCKVAEEHGVIFHDLQFICFLGDYLVLKTNGSLEKMSKKAFEDTYEPILELMY